MRLSSKLTLVLQGRFGNMGISLNVRRSGQLCRTL